jgi:hypothetical protein
MVQTNKTVIFSSLHDQVTKSSKTAVTITIHPKAKISVDKFRVKKKSLFKVVVSLKSINQSLDDIALLIFKDSNITFRRP